MYPSLPSEGCLRRRLRGRLYTPMERFVHLCHCDLQRAQESRHCARFRRVRHPASFWLARHRSHLVGCSWRSRTLPVRLSFCLLRPASDPVSLRGHRDQITAIRFVRPAAESAPSTSTGIAPGYLLTASKDTFLKLWDLQTQHCTQTVVAHRSEVWTMDLNPEQDLVFTGSGEGELKAWKIDHEALAQGLRETDTGEVRLQVIISPQCRIHGDFLGLEISPSCFDSPSGLFPPCLANHLPPTSTIPCRPVP